MSLEYKNLFPKNFQIRILLFCLDSSVVNIISQIVKDLGGGVDIVESVGEASEALLRNRYNLLLVDIDLPDDDLEDFIRQRLKEFDSEAVIALTGRAQENELMRLLELGIADVLYKPLQLREIKLHIIQNLRRRIEAEEITEHLQFLRKEMNRKKKQAEAYFEAVHSISHPVYIVNVDDYRINLANPSAASGKALRQKTCYQLTHNRTTPCRDENDVCPVREVKKTGKPTITEHCHYDKKGREHIAEIHACPIYDENNDIKQVLLYNIDITERVKNAEELSAAKELAEKSCKARGRFLADMSHEIRTPMNAIIGMNNLALETELTPDQRYYLSTVQKSAESLLDLINDVLDFSKIEADQLTLEKKQFVLQESISGSIETLSLMARRKKVGIGYEIAEDVPKVLIGDQSRLRQVLLNLISNAIKFTKVGSVFVSVNVSSESASGAELQFSVKDTGVGIPESEQDHIFDCFVQADNSVFRKYGGTGLGLSICRKLTQMFNGELWLDSEPGVGSTFYFTAWFETVDQEEENVDSQCTPSENSTLLSPLDILLVEDNLFNLDLAKIVLEQQGHSVTTATNGVEALEELAENNYNVVFMDVEMPDMDGITTSTIIRQCERDMVELGHTHFRLLERLQKRVSGKHTPIIAMTANAMSGDREKCIQAGMDDYVAKPFQPQSLDKVLKTVLE